MDRIKIIFEQLFENFADAIPRFLGAIIIFIIGYAIAKVVAFVIRRVLSTIGVDSIAAKLNEIDFIDKSKVKIVPSNVLSKLLYYIILLIFTIVAAEYLAVDAVTGLVRDVLNYIPSLIAGLLVLVIGLLLAQFIQNILVTALKSLGVPSAKIIGTFVFYFVFLMAVITALTQVGIDTDFISSNLSIIIAGCVFAFALGYGLASKDMMANFLASFYSKEKVKIGDLITIDEMRGEVIKVDSTSITLLTNNSKIVIPLSKLTSESFEIHDAD
jgi:small-conductance mechanosensitive channel